MSTDTDTLARGVPRQDQLPLVSARSLSASVEFSETEIRFVIKRLLVDVIGNLKDNLVGRISDEEMAEQEVFIQTLRAKLARLVGDAP